MITPRPREELVEQIRQELFGDSLSVDEVADVFGAASMTVEGWIRKGRLRGFKASTSWRVTLDEVRRFFREDFCTAAPAPKVSNCDDR